MKKLFLNVTAALAVITCFISCSKEPINPIERSFSNTGFTAIEAGNESELTVTKGNTFSITAKGEARDINDLVIQNTGTTLKIDFNSYKPNRKIIRVTVTMPSFEGIIVWGQSQAVISGFTETVPVSLKALGQSVIRLHSNSPKFIVNASGQSKIELLGGIVSVIESDASGESQIAAYALAAASVTSVGTGQSTTKIKATNSLTANASGQSRIYYQGNPAVKNITASGQAKVIQE